MTQIILFVIHRNLEPILPTDISSSYRMVMNRDFTNVVDDYSIINKDKMSAKDKNKQEIYLQTISNINMTRDRMDDDEDNNVMFTNWTQVGCIFNEFVRAIIKETGFDNEVSQLIWSCPDEVRHGARVDGSRVKNGFEVSDVNLEYQAYSFIYSKILNELDKDPNCAIGKTCAEFMKTYFTTSINKNDYSFLIDNQNENSHLDHCGIHDNDDGNMRGTTLSKTTLLGPNPIDVALRYPRHSDGSIENPIKSAFLCKYSKSHEVKARIIIPGKLSKCQGEVDPPRSPQLIPLSSGKFRHIASFSLKELRQLGWDGSLYHSKSVGTWVPYINGYDSDDNDSYEPFDRKEARHNGIIGLPIDLIKKYMMVYNTERMEVVQLKK